MRYTLFSETHTQLHSMLSHALLCSMTIALQRWCFERERQAWRTRRRTDFLCSWGAYEVIWFLIFGFAAVQSHMPQ